VGRNSCPIFNKKLHGKGTEIPYIMHELIFIEIEQFSKKLDKVSDVSFMIELQNELLINPEKGDLIKGTAGARKIRMASVGRGKRGGSRVIYYYNRSSWGNLVS